MNCPFTRGGPVVGALVLDRLGIDEGARGAESQIHPNVKQPGLVEAWMAERALLNGRADESREIAERTLAFGRGASIEEPPYELAGVGGAPAAAGGWAGL